MAGDGRVVALAILGGRYVGPSVQVHLPTLARRVETLPRSIDTVVLFDEPVPDGAMVTLIDDMLAAYEDLDVDGLVQFVPVTEAVKRVESSVVAEGIDRSSLVAIRCPEVFDRTRLESAVKSHPGRLWVNPTELIALDGGRVALYDPATALYHAAG